jgi:hypothetical protein
MTEEAFCARDWQRKGGETLACLPPVPPPGAAQVRVCEHQRHERRHPRAALALCLERLTWLRAFQIAEATAGRRANQRFPSAASQHWSGRRGFRVPVASSCQCPSLVAKRWD